MSLDKRQFTASEATSLGAYGGNWRAADALDISGATQADFAIDLSTNILAINTQSEIYILIDDVSDTAIDTLKDFIIPAGVYTISFPKGVQSGDMETQLHMHVLQVTSVASKEVRIVES